MLLHELVRISTELKPDLKLPKLRGSIQAELDIQHNFKTKSLVDFQVKTDGVYVNEYEVGNSQISGKYNDNTINIQNAKLKNSSGTASISDAILKLDNNKYFRANVNLDSIEISKFLNTINIKNVPIYLPIKADIPCFGNIKPKFFLTCKGIAHLQKVDVWDNLDKKLNIVSLGPTRLIGRFDVDDEKVTYDSQIKINDSYGWSKGMISYEKGFNIDYGGTLKSLEKDILNLANLKIEGSSVVVKGRTWGASNWGRIDLNLDGKNMWLEDFGLGNPNFDLIYKNGNLNFRNIQSFFGNTRFKGLLSLNLKSSLIKIDATAPFIDAEDLISLLKRKVQLPMSIKGTGSATIEAKGPLQFNYLSYNLKSNFFRGSIAKESYDQLAFNVESKNGFVESKNINIAKADSRILLKGKVNPKGDLDAVILGERLRLEQSEYLNDLGFNIGGQLDFTMAMRGPILEPNTELHGRLSKMLIAEKPEPDSSFWLRLNKSSIEGKAKFIGNVVQTEFNIPYNANLPFRLYLKSENWNFAHMFNMFSGAEIQKDYLTLLSSEVLLESPKNWIWNTNGYIKISKARLSKGEHYLENNMPMEILFNKGLMNTNNFRLDGPSSFIELKSSDSNYDNVDLALNGKFSLELVTLLTPFLDELRGVSSVTLNVKGPAINPNILGSAYMQDSFIKLKGLPHPFENLTGDFLFNQKNLLINAMKSDFAGGVFTADGRIQFLSLNKIPINIKAQINKANLNVPEGFKTKGAANLYIKGDFIPYTLGGSYLIESGQVKVSLIGSGSDEQRIQPSDFLPKFLIKESTDPLLFNLDVNIPNSVEVNAIFPGGDVQAGITGNMKVKGSPARPLLKGNIRSEPGGIMNFRSNEFNLTSANIEYNDQPATEPNLQINAKASIRAKQRSNEIEASGDEYEISLEVSGNAKKPVINLSSTPLLSENDIVSLLAFGVITSSSQDIGSTELGQSSAAAVGDVGAQFVKQQLGITKAVEETIGLNIDISAVIDDENTISPKVSMSRQFTPKFGMSISRTQGKAPSNEMKFEYKFNREFSVIGQVQQLEADGTSSDSADTIQTQEKLGLDLEYKFQFK